MVHEASGDETASATPAGRSTTNLLIVSKRYPAGFPMRDLGRSAVQRVAKERRREPAAIDAFMATVMGPSLRACQNWPCG